MCQLAAPAPPRVSSCAVASSSLSDYLNRALTRAGSRRVLAEQLDLTRQRLSRLLRNEGYGPGVETCIRLAQILAIEPGDVLRAAGHTGMAKLLAEVYQRHDLSADDRRWRRLRAQLTPEDAAYVDGLLERLVAGPRPSARKSARK